MKRLNSKDIVAVSGGICKCYNYYTLPVREHKTINNLPECFVACCVNGIKQIKFYAIGESIMYDCLNQQQHIAFTLQEKRRGDLCQLQQGFHSDEI